MYASTRLVSRSRKIPKPLGSLRLYLTESVSYEPLLLQCQKFHLRERSRLRGAGARLHCEVNSINTRHNTTATVYYYCCCAAAKLFYGMSHTTVTPPASLCTSRLIYTLIDCCLTPHALLLPRNLANRLSTDKGSQLEAYLEAICSSIYTS